MSSLLLSALAATTVIAATSVGVATDASAATRHTRYSYSYGSSMAAPVVRQYPYGAYNSYYGAEVPGAGFRRDVNPLSGTPRWNGSGGAP
jgi:hypothetical protein